MRVNSPLIWCVLCFFFFFFFYRAATADPSDSKFLRLQLRVLKKKLARRAAAHRRQRQAWQRERARLLRQVRTLQLKAKASVQLEIEGVFSNTQLKRAVSKRRVSWTVADLTNAVGLRCVSRKAYDYVHRAMKIPLPS